MSRLLFFIAGLTVPTTVALAASGPFFSLGNTDFIVLISFIIFVGAIFYFRAPKFAGKLLDGQIAKIRDRIEEAEKIQSEAREMVVSLQNQKTETATLAENIISQAQKDAQLALDNARTSIDMAVERRLAAARMQIAAAEETAVQEIRNEAIDVAINAASEVIASSMDDDFRKNQIDRSIRELNANLD